MRSGNQFFEDSMKKRGRVGARTPDTGFSENWQAMLGYAMDTELTISRQLNSGVIEERNRFLKDLVRERKLNAIPYISTSRGQSRELDWDGLAIHAKSKGFDVMDDVELENSIQDTLDQRTAMVNDITARRTNMGAVGGFLGFMHGVGMDPVNIAVAVGGPIALSAYIKRGTSAWKAAAYEGGLAAGAEIPIQFLAADWKNDIGVEHTFTDALIDMSAAGLFSGTIAGLAKKLKNMGDWTHDKFTEVERKEIYSIMAELKEMSNIKEMNLNPEEALKNIEKIREKYTNTWYKGETYIPAGKPRIKLKVKSIDDPSLDSAKKEEHKSDAEAPESKETGTKVKGDKETPKKKSTETLDTYEMLDAEFKAFLKLSKDGLIGRLKNNDAKLARINEMIKKGETPEC